MDSDNSFEDTLSTDDGEESTYTIRPPFSKKFSAPTVKEIIKVLLVDELANKKYLSLNEEETTKYLSEIVLKKVKGMPYEGYKYVVQVAFAEQKGQGMKMLSLCSWDADTDNCASVFYLNEQVICVATVFAIYYY